MAKPHMCDPALFSKDLSGRVYIITGANSGIGLVTATQLAKQGAQVILACRRVAEGQRCADEIVAKQSSANVKAMRLDLGDLASVRTFAAAFLADHDQLDGLVNNAGVMNTPDQKTTDGFEMQLGVNHFGHFLLTELLTDVLKRSAPARVVCVSSCYHDMAMGREGKIDFDDLNFKTRKYDGWEAYAQSKLANLLHAKGLAKRLADTGVTTASVHPGWVRTNLAKNTMPIWVQDIFMRPFMGLIGMIEPWQGAQTTLHTLLDDEVPKNSGGYYSQLGLYRTKEAKAGGWPMTSPNPIAADETVADRLWDVSLEATAAS